MCFNSLVILSRFVVSVIYAIQSTWFILLKRCGREGLEDHLPSPVRFNLVSMERTPLQSETGVSWALPHAGGAGLGCGS